MSAKRERDQRIIGLVAFEIHDHTACGSKTAVAAADAIFAKYDLVPRDEDTVRVPVEMAENLCTYAYWASDDGVTPAWQKKAKADANALAALIAARGKG